MTALRGINIGGWLVLERWMSPSLFANTTASDEFMLAQSLGKKEFEKRLRAHRDSFITESDFENIRALGFDLVRLPVGYWLFDDHDGFVHCKPHVDAAFGWAKKFGLRVLIDLHTAPGSQNGWDHSGRAGELGWHRSDTNINSTLSVLQRIAKEYGSHPYLYGVEVLNEPRWDVPMALLSDFYARAWHILRSEGDPRFKVIFSDSFRPKEVQKALKRLKISDYVLDIHLYQLFTEDDRGLSFEEHLHKVGKWHKELLQITRGGQEVLVGEWSAALDHSTFEGHDAALRRHMTKQYFEVQQRVFNESVGAWCYWSYKTEGRGPWSFSDCKFSL